MFYHVKGSKAKEVPENHRKTLAHARKFCEDVAKDNPGKTVELTNDKGETVGVYHYKSGTMNVVQGRVTGKVSQHGDLDGGVQF